MRILYLECNMGAAGDMITAALAELLPSREAFAERMNRIGLAGLKFRFTDHTACGIRGSHAVVEINGEEEISNDVASDGSDHAHLHSHTHEHEHHDPHMHGHHHEHAHEHHHEHASLDDIMSIVNALDIPAEVRTDVRGVYALIAEAEAHAHGTKAEHIHFHEVGMMDAICDITAVCLLMHTLAPDRVIVSPVCTGYGEVRCMHGIVPVPAPATEYLIRDIPTYAGHTRGELLTPTGAALIKYYADEFNQRPMMTVTKTGYGMGMKEFETTNCVRAMIGETDDIGTDAISEISCNLDDMTGESIGFAADILRKAGALDVYYTPIQMKKDRPGVQLTCLCRIEDETRMSEMMLRHTTTLGVRICRQTRRILSRSVTTVQSAYGEVQIKHAEGFGISKCKPEYESIAALAIENGVTLEEIKRTISDR